MRQAATWRRRLRALLRRPLRGLTNRAAAAVSSKAPAFLAPAARLTARHEREIFHGLYVLLLLLASIGEGRTEELLSRKDSITVFGGIYTTENMGRSFNPLANHDSTYLIAGAYRHEFIKLPWNIVLGGEIGVGLRFGTGSYGEIWAAPTARVVGIPLGNAAVMSIGFVAGFSGITNPTKLERQREYEHSGNSKLLFYFSPELTLALRKVPNREIVFRLHHRSGLYGTLGQMREGSNTHVVGLRWLF